MLFIFSALVFTLVILLGGSIVWLVLEGINMLFFSGMCDIPFGVCLLVFIAMLLVEGFIINRE